MAKKVVIGVVALVLIGALAFGAVNHTLARLDSGDGGYGRGQGIGVRQDETQQGESWQGDDRGRGQGRGGNGSAWSECDEGCEDGAGWGGRGQGGYDGERADVDGRGGNRQGRGGEQHVVPEGNRQGRGGGQDAQTGGNRMGRGGSDPTDRPERGIQPGQQAEWQTLRGLVTSADADSLVVKMADGKQVEVVNRAWRFAQSEGFSANGGDTLSLYGFYDGDRFEAGTIINETTGNSVDLRDETGRPLWAGNGRW